MQCGVIPSILTATCLGDDVDGTVAPEPTTALWIDRLCNLSGTPLQPRSNTLACRTLSRHSSTLIARHSRFFVCSLWARSASLSWACCHEVVEVCPCCCCCCCCWCCSGGSSLHDDAQTQEKSPPVAVLLQRGKVRIPYRAERVEKPNSKLFLRARTGRPSDERLYISRAPDAVNPSGTS